MLHKDIIQEIFQYIPPKYYYNFRAISKTFDLVFHQEINKKELYPDKEKYNKFLIQLGKKNDIYNFKKGIIDPNFHDKFLFILNLDNEEWIDWLYHKIMDIKIKELQEYYIELLAKTLFYHQHFHIFDIYFRDEFEKSFGKGWANTRFHIFNLRSKGKLETAKKLLSITEKDNIIQEIYDSALRHGYLETIKYLEIRYKEKNLFEKYYQEGIFDKENYLINWQKDDVEIFYFFIGKLGKEHMLNIDQNTLLRCAYEYGCSKIFDEILQWYNNPNDINYLQIFNKTLIRKFNLILTKKIIENIKDKSQICWSGGVAEYIGYYCNDIKFLDYCLSVVSVSTTIEYQSFLSLILEYANFVNLFIYVEEIYEKQYEHIHDTIINLVIENAMLYDNLELLKYLHQKYKRDLSNISLYEVCEYDVSIRMLKYFIHNTNINTNVDLNIIWENGIFHSQNEPPSLPIKYYLIEEKKLNNI